MAEETPAILDMTVIWRPSEEVEYRVDWVTAEADKSAAIHAAATNYLDGIEWADDEVPVTTATLLAQPYDLIAIFDGHVNQTFPAW